RQPARERRDRWRRRGRRRWARDRIVAEGADREGPRARAADRLDQRAARRHALPRCQRAEQPLERSLVAARPPDRIGHPLRLDRPGILETFFAARLLDDPPTIRGKQLRAVLHATLTGPA